MKFKNILTVLYFVLVFYSFSAGTLLGLVGYPSWKLIGAAEFAAFHQMVDAATASLFALIFFLSIPLSILTIWFGHPAMSRRWLIIAVLLHLSAFVMTIAFALPIQAQLNQGKSIELIDSLIFYHYLRSIAGLIGTIINCFLLFQIFKKASA